MRNPSILCEHAYSNGKYKAMPTVQAADGGFRAVVVVGSLADDDYEPTRHTVPTEFSSVEDALKAGRVYAREILELMPSR